MKQVSLCSNESHSASLWCHTRKEIKIVFFKFGTYNSHSLLNFQSTVLHKFALYPCDEKFAIHSSCELCGSDPSFLWSCISPCDPRCEFLVLLSRLPDEVLTLTRKLWS